MDPFLIIVAVAIALFMFMQFRSAKKRRTEAADLQQKMVPGTEIMTNYGLYGTILTLDEETNIATIETTPGTVLRIHRQTILKAVEEESVEPDADIAAADEPVVDVDPATAAPAPEFGERVAEAKKPARKSAKKDGE